MTTAIPLLRCRKLDDVLPFYESLGFELTTRQERPTPYASTRWRNADLHFYAANSAGICLFIVDEVEELHAAFKRIGTWASNARITRMKPGQSRFTVFDPAGNSERRCEPRRCCAISRTTTPQPRRCSPRRSPEPETRTPTK